MVPVIRIDDEVWKQLQERAKPLIDTPNDVLRRILGVDKPISSEIENSPTEKEIELKEEAKKMNSSIFIVINAAGEYPNDENARNGRRLTERRVCSGIDILAPSRFAEARRKLKKGSMIAMHQGGAKSFRGKYGAGQLMAAGRVKGEARELEEKDKQDYSEDYDLTKQCYPRWPLVGIIFYEFPMGMAKQPLPKEAVPYQPRRGNNFIEIKPDDPRYAALDRWWSANS